MAPKTNPNSQRGQRKATAAEKGKRKAPPSPNRGSSSDSEPTPRRTTRPRGSGIRIDEGNTQSNIPATRSSDFRNTSEKKSFDERIKGRKLTKSKSVDFKFFDDEGFEFPTWIRNYGLEAFLTEKEEVYEHLIRLFYFYLQYDERIKKYTSYVQGVFIVFNIIEFSQMLQIPFELEDEREEVDLKEKIEYLTGNSSLAPATFQIRHLKSVDYRILFNIVCYCLYPRAGGYDKVTVDDVDLLYAILTSSKMCLAHSMLQYMIQQKDRTNGRLPFGVALTRLLKHFKVNLKNEKPVKFTSYTIINESTLKRMKIVKKNGQWIDKLKDKEDEEEEAEEEQVEKSAPTPAQVEELPEIQEVEAAQTNEDFGKAS